MDLEQEVINDNVQDQVIVDSGTPTPDEQARPEDNNESKDVFVWDESKYKDLTLSPEISEVIKKKDEQIFHKELAFQRHTKEVDLSRKHEFEYQQKERQLIEQQKKLAEVEEQIRESFYDDPQAYDNHVFSRKQVDQELQNLQVQRQALVNEQVIRTNMPDIDTVASTKEFQESLRRELIIDGASENETSLVMEQWKHGEWKYAVHSKVLSIAEKAKYQIEINKYKEQIAKLSQSPDEVGRKIAQVANQRPNVPAGSYSVERTYTTQEIKSMSDAEIKEALAKSRAMLTSK